MIEKAKRSYEQYERHLNRVKSCSTTFELGYVQKSYTEFHVHPCAYSCNSYFCEHCAQKKRKMLLRKLRAIKNANNLRFLTLTLSASDYDPTTSISKISEFFNTLCKLLRYRKYKFQYFKIIEMTKNNISHLHILIDTYIPAPLISSLWKQITGSYIIKILQVKDKKQVFTYISKYITKTLTSYSNLLFYFYNKRRYSYSKFFFDVIPKLEKFFMTGIRFFDVSLFESIFMDYFSHFLQFKYIKFSFYKPK